MTPPPSRSAFEAVLSAFAEAVIILDGRTRIVWLNPAAETLTGYSMKRAAGRPFTLLFRREPQLAHSLGRAMAEGVSLTSHDAHFRPPAGERVPVSVAVYPVEDGGYVLVLRNLLHLKLLERTRAAEDRIEELSTLAAGIAHEIKNPLGGIRGAAQLLGAEHPDQGEFTDLILREVDRINRLVVDLIELNQPDVFEKVPVNIYPVLDDVTRLLAPAMAEKQIACERRFDPSLPPVLGNDDRLRQILLNLAKNAVEASPRGGKVLFETALAWKAPRTQIQGNPHRYIRISVFDEGGGIDEESHGKLFTPFHSRKRGGTGLGLSVTLRMVRAHEGDIEIGNRTDGVKGVEAAVFLPYV